MRVWSAALKQFVSDLSAMAEAVNEFELRQAPSDGIAAVRFAPSSLRLLVASWDAVSATTVVKSRIERERETRAELRE